MEKTGCEDFRYWETWGCYFCIWRCQNLAQGPREQEDIVERSIDGFYGLGTLRFRLYLDSIQNFAQISEVEAGT